MSKPYERIAGESHQAFAAFTTYRDLGPDRSIRKAAEVVGKSAGHLERWSAKFDWIARAAAWDDEADRRRREAQAKAVEKMAERHAKVAMRALELVNEKLESMSASDLSPAVLARVMAEAAKLERLSRGEPSERVDGTSAPATADEVREFLARSQGE